MRLFGWFRQAPTRRLTDPAYSVERGGSAKRALFLGLLVIALTATAFGAFRFFQSFVGPSQRVSELEIENAKLQEELTKARLQTEMDAATRSELENQLSTLNAELRRLREEVGFFKRSQP
ncbi:MAG: hypothetical protein KF909_15070, partial [Rhodocyclaceae bacterium]|nr:hypothetical protein [Rhodocyclaceae bacterium]